MHNDHTPESSVVRATLYVSCAPGRCFFSSLFPPPSATQSISCKIVFKRGIEICIISSGLVQWEDACWTYLPNSNHLPVFLIGPSCTHWERRGRPVISEWPKVLEPVIPVRIQPSFSVLLQKVWSGFGVGPRGVAWGRCVTRQSLRQKGPTGLHKSQSSLREEAWLWSF